jgi:hypothetical protein
MTTEQIQATKLSPSVNLMRDHIARIDGNGYMLFLDELHACHTEQELMSSLINTLDARFQYDVVDLLPSSNSETLPHDILDRKEAIETLHRCSYYGAETFNAQFTKSLRYALYNIHPESSL